MFTKGQGKPGLFGEFSIICIKVREKSGKTNYLVHISFIVLQQVTVHYLSIRLHFPCLFFVNMLNGGLLKVGVFDYESGKSQGILRES